MYYWFDDKKTNDWIRKNSSLLPSVCARRIPLFDDSKYCETIVSITHHLGIGVPENLCVSRADIGNVVQMDGNLVGCLKRAAEADGSFRFPFLLGQGFDLVETLSAGSFGDSNAKGFAQMMLANITWADEEDFAKLRNKSSEIRMDLSNIDFNYFRWCVSEQDKRSVLLALNLI